MRFADTNSPTPLNIVAPESSSAHMAEGTARGLRRGESLGQGGAEAGHWIPWDGDQLLGGGRGLVWTGSVWRCVARLCGH